MRRARDYSPLPAEVFTRKELQALWDFRRRWGAVLQTREPAEDRTFVRLSPVRVPLIELAGRATYRRLEFQALRWADRRVK